MKKTIGKLASLVLAMIMVIGVLANPVFAANEEDFDDVAEGKWYYGYVMMLKEDEIVGGYKGTNNFEPLEKVSRREAAKMIALAAKFEYAGKTADFTDVEESDWATGYIAALEEKNVVKGFGDSNLFKPGANIQRGHAAKMVGKAFGLKEGSLERTLTDLPADAEVNAAIKVLASNGIVKGYRGTEEFRPAEEISRAEFSKILCIAMVASAIQEAEAEGAISEQIAKAQALLERLSVAGKDDDIDALNYLQGRVDALELTVTDVSAINAKTIEVEFNKAVEDTSKATVELLRGTFKQNVTVKWAEDNKSVQLIGAGNFQAADYTVSITGLTEEALTAEIKIEAQKVTSIEILSDVAVLSANPAGGLIAGETATVGYIVKDQYGTDITKTTDLTTNHATDVTIATKGTVTLSNLNNGRVGDLVPVVLVHAQSGTTTSATLKLSAAATVADIAVEGVYNAKGEKVELKDNTKATDVYLVLNLKDQYGNDIKPAAGHADGVTGVIVTNTNPLVAKLVNDKVTTATIDGDLEFVVKFAKLDTNNEFKAGSAELLFITTMDGKTFNHTLNVVETKTTDAVTVGQPEFAIVGEDVLLPITILDKEGNVITDRDLLSHTTKGIKVNGSPAVKANLSVKDGQVYYKLPAPLAGSADSFTTATVTTSTNKISTVTYKITATAKPVAVRGLKKPLVLKANTYKTIAFADVNVEDQYGRTMKALTGYTVKVKEITGVDKVVTVDGSNKVTAGGKNGTATITISLHDSEGEEVANSAVEQQVRVTDGKEYTGFEIAEIGKVQASNVEGAGYKEFTVNGILGEGKVALDASEYTAELSGGDGTALLIGAVKTVANGKITINKAALNHKNLTALDTEFTLKVTIHATGAVLEEKFVVSADARKTEDFFFTTTEEGADNYKDAKAITEAIVKNGFTLAASQNVVVGDGEKQLNIATTDQYGNNKVVNAAGTVTIVPEKQAEVTITDNGKANAKVELADNVEESTVTVKVKVGNATKELKVKVIKVITP